MTWNHLRKTSGLEAGECPSRRNISGSRKHSSHCRIRPEEAERGQEEQIPGSQSRWPAAAERQRPYFPCQVAPECAAAMRQKMPTTAAEFCTDSAEARLQL